MTDSNPNPVASFPPVVVSGIQPSGTLHIGNYFGAIRQHIELHAAHESYFFIVNYHALTTLQDATALKSYSIDVALDYLALGFDPDKSHLFLQSDVPQVTELSWMFYTITPVSQLEKGFLSRTKWPKDLEPMQDCSITPYCKQPIFWFTGARAFRWGQIRSKT